MPDMSDVPRAHGLNAAAAWAQLQAGNQRMLTGTHDNARRSTAARLAGVDGQWPIVAVLGCADSRVAPELIFDAGFGEIFTVRSAGPTLGHTEIGSLEYAVLELGVPLILVMTHESCGALGAARHLAATGAAPAPESGGAPAADTAAKTAAGTAADTAADLPGMLPMVMAGVRRSTALATPDRVPALHAADLIKSLLEHSPPIREAVEAGKIAIKGGVYSITTGEVAPLS